MNTKSLFVLLATAALRTTVTQAQITVDLHIYNDDFGSADHVHLNPTIHPGDTVHWIWDTGFHSTTSAAGQAESWNSGDHSPAFTFDHTFMTVGTFNYYC